VVVVPSHFAECLDIAPGDSLSIEMQKKQIIMTPIAGSTAKLSPATEAEQTTPERSDCIG
jgi:antitoxin component of MazEF toxin-antitoxin module